MLTSPSYASNDGPVKLAHTKKGKRDMADAPTWWGPLAAGVSFTVATIGFGAALELLLIEEIRSKVRDKLMRVSQMADNWPTLFLAMFDRLFDPKGKGRPRFWRSAAASMLVLAALLVAWAILLPERAGFAISYLESKDVVWLIVLFVIPINFVGDFGSLWESRLVIGRMAVTPHNAGDPRMGGSGSGPGGAVRAVLPARAAA